jgi:hypothetical protein
LLLTVLQASQQHGAAPLTCAEAVCANILTMKLISRALLHPEGPQDAAGTGGDAAAAVEETVTRVPLQPDNLSH